MWREGNVTMPRGNLGPEQAQTPYTGKDVRYTARDDAVYAFLMAWPSGGSAALEALSSKVAQVCGVRLLCHDTKAGGGGQTGRGTLVRWEQNEDALAITLPLEPPPSPSCRFAFGLRIDGVAVARGGGDTATSAAGKDGLCPPGFYCPSGVLRRRDCPLSRAPAFTGK